MTRARPRDDDSEAMAARALADPTRRALLRHLGTLDGPAGVRTLAERFDLHPNAVRQHLAHLRDAGLVLEELERTGGPGRPRLAYRPNPDRDDRTGWNPYETLSQLLVQVASGTPARAVGAAYGRRLAAAAPEQSATDVLAGVARRHGFQPRLTSDGDGVTLVLGRCPFAASVSADHLVCDLHHGIAEGITRARGGAVVASLEIAAPQRGGCRFHIRVTAPESQDRTDAPLLHHSDDQEVSGP